MKLYAVYDNDELVDAGEFDRMKKIAMEQKLRMRPYYDEWPLPNNNDESAESPGLQLLVKYEEATGLEKSELRDKLTDYILSLEGDESDSEITGTCYAVISSKVPDGKVVATWDEASRLTQKVPGGKVKKCNSPEEAKAVVDTWVLLGTAVQAKASLVAENDPAATEEIEDSSPPWDDEPFSA
jgi:hypothetical protein